jgi:DNA-binding LytR/AlgR family response regulator
MEHSYDVNDHNSIEVPLPEFNTHDIDHRSMPFSGAGKQSFLVYKHNTYRIILTENIAFFCFKHKSTVIVSFDHQEYAIDYSLKQVQQLLSGIQFFRLNRQCLINFTVIKEVEHYFARKLLVKLTVPFREKLLVSKKKASCFLSWLEHR